MEETTPRRRGAQQGNAAEPTTFEVFDTPQAASDDLQEYVAQQERLKIADGIVLVRLAHPAAVEGYREGAFGGIKMERGEKQSYWSDGSHS